MDGSGIVGKDFRVRCRIFFTYIIEGGVSLIPDFLTIGLGISIIVLGTMVHIGLVHLTPATVLGYTAAATFMTISDLLRQMLELKVMQPKRVNFVLDLVLISQILCVMSLLIIPQLQLNILSSDLDRVNNTFLLLGFGITVLVMGFRSLIMFVENKKSDKY